MTCMHQIEHQRRKGSPFELTTSSSPSRGELTQDSSCIIGLNTFLNYYYNFFTRNLSSLNCRDDCSTFSSTSWNASIALLFSCFSIYTKCIHMRNPYYHHYRTRSILLPPFQIVGRFSKSRYTVFAMYLYLDLLKRPTIWNGGSIALMKQELMHTISKSELDFQGSMQKLKVKQREQ